MSYFEIYNDDCLKVLPTLKPNSVSLVLCDLPYDMTAHKWDSLIPFDKLWEEYHRIAKSDAIFCLFATQPFTTKLISSNIDEFRYCWIWEKETPTGYLNSNYAPMKKTEDICIFSKCTVGSLSKNPIRFNPQNVIEVNRLRRNNPNSTLRANWGYTVGGNSLNSDKEYVQKFTNYPTNILKYTRDDPQVHPTQKPVALLEYLIRTYTSENEIVLDNCMGSGSSGVACINMNRQFIGIEIDQKYFEIAKERIDKATQMSEIFQL